MIQLFSSATGAERTCATFRSVALDCVRKVAPVVACVVAGLLLSSSPAHAGDRWAYIVPASGHLADYVTSLHFSTNGSACEENNPLTSHSDGRFDARKGAAWTAAVIGAEWAIVKLTSKSKSKAVRWIGKSVAIGGGAVGFSAAAWNTIPTHACDRLTRLADGTLVPR